MPEWRLPSPFPVDPALLRRVDAVFRGSREAILGPGRGEPIETGLFLEAVREELGTDAMTAVALVRRYNALLNTLAGSTRLAALATCSADAVDRSYAAAARLPVLETGLRRMLDRFDPASFGREVAQV
jgi:hypothetical protein